MQPTTDDREPTRGSFLRRYGPLLGIGIVVVGVILALIVTSGGDDDEAADTTASPTTEADTGDDTSTDTSGSVEDERFDDPVGVSSLAELPEGVVPFSLADAEGVVDDYEWGDRCDLETGLLQTASFVRNQCYAIFDGDNGGATDEGVTADAVKIVIYQSPDDDRLLRAVLDQIGNDDTTEQIFETARNYVDYFSQYFESYGREVDLVTYEGTGESLDATAARADAAQIAEEEQPFMVIGGPLLINAFADELAAREIPCLACTPTQSTRWYEERAPYVYDVQKMAEQTQVHVAEYIGKQLAGRPAEHAGDPAYQDQERRFGTIRVLTGDESQHTHEQFVARLSEQGVELSEDQTYADPILDLATKQTAIIAKLKEEGITSVIFAGDPLAPQLLTAEATKQNYFPEWILTGSALVDTTIFSRTYDQEQWAHAFGVSNLVARQPVEDSGSFFIHECFKGVEPPADQTAPVVIAPAAVMFPILQRVGPNLTREAMFETLEHYPPANVGYTTTWQVSFGDNGIYEPPDIAALDDTTEIWWDAEATGPDEIGGEGTGMFQYVDGGTRYLPGEWPERDTKAFDPDGAVALYDEPPEGEESVCRQPGGPDGTGDD